jgi:uncharacterized coiled-coil protein SlyX
MKELTRDELERSHAAQMTEIDKRLASLAAQAADLERTKRTLQAVHEKMCRQLPEKAATPPETMPTPPTPPKPKKLPPAFRVLTEVSKRDRITRATLLEALRPLTPAQEKAIDSALSALKQQGLIDGQRINGSPFLSYRLLPEGKRRLAVLKKRLGQ